MKIQLVFFTWIIIMSFAVSESKNGNTSSYYAISSLSSIGLTSEPAIPTMTPTSSAETTQIHEIPTSKPPWEPQTTAEKNLTITPVVTTSLTGHISTSPITEIETTVTMPTSMTTIETVTSPQTAESSSTKSPSTTVKTSSTTTETTISEIPTITSVVESSGPASLLILVLPIIPFCTVVLLLSYGIWYKCRKRRRMLLNDEGESKRTTKPGIPGYDPENFSPENFKYREKATKLTAHVDEPLEPPLNEPQIEEALKADEEVPQVNFSTEELQVYAVPII
uniref:Uncharacterized protein n=2 Tax=Acrobeloides nanus TaxID=290746 RepID=A0A914DVS2_9BILA